MNIIGIKDTRGQFIVHFRSELSIDESKVNDNDAIVFYKRREGVFAIPEQVMVKMTPIKDETKASLPLKERFQFFRQVVRKNFSSNEIIEKPADHTIVYELVDSDNLGTFQDFLNGINNPNDIGSTVPEFFDKFLDLIDTADDDFISGLQETYNG